MMLSYVIYLSQSVTNDFLYTQKVKKMYEIWILNLFWFCLVTTSIPQILLPKIERKRENTD